MWQHASPLGPLAATEQVDGMQQPLAPARLRISPTGHLAQLLARSHKHDKSQFWPNWADHSAPSLGRPALGYLARPIESTHGCHTPSMPGMGV